MWTRWTQSKTQWWNLNKGSAMCNCKQRPRTKAADNTEGQVLENGSANRLTFPAQHSHSLVKPLACATTRPSISASLLLPSPGPLTHQPTTRCNWPARVRMGRAEGTLWRAPGCSASPAAQPHTAAGRTRHRRPWLPAVRHLPLPQHLRFQPGAPWRWCSCPQPCPCRTRPGEA